MKLRTKIEPLDYSFKIAHKDAVLSLGSCFSEHISDKLTYLGYQVLKNPCGITFNPASLLTTIKRVKQPESLHENQLNFHNGLYSHSDFHGSFNSSDPKLFISAATDSLLRAKEALKETKFIFITLGTCWVYRSKKSDLIVNNCHKLPADQFSKELLQLDTVHQLLAEMRAELIAATNSNLNIIWTVSPVRHVKNGLIHDRKSKSIAILAVHNMVDNFEDCHYFPSYEVVTDDLRDYRFFNSDLIHPTEQGVDYIFNLFEEATLDAEEADVRKRVLSISNRKQHNALFPSSDEHQFFLKKIQEDIKRLIIDYPYLKGRL